MEEKGTCKFCNKNIPVNCIRCDECDLAWQEGRASGIEELKEKLQETANTFINLIQHK